MAKLEIQYTKRYYKSTTKVVDIPDNVKEEDQGDWVRANSLELFEDEITAASLNYEEDEVYFLDTGETI
jgi:hypothetical protein